MRGPIVLLVLDGWGVSEPSAGNAILKSAPRVMPALVHGDGCRLEASGRAVGVPDGVMGNSEVGHLTIGAGRIIEQDLVRISAACRDGSIAERPAFRAMLDACDGGSGRLHILGLCSDAGVHAMLEHQLAIARAASRAGAARVFLHPFTDGRDTPPLSALDHVARLERGAGEISRASVGTIGGRYWGMDRDQRWDRTERAYRALLGDAPRASSALDAVRSAHARGVTDEFIEPVVVDAESALRDGDVVLHANFRADRGRQMIRALHDPRFDGFEATTRRLASLVTMTEYSADFGVPVLFEPQRPEQTMGQVVAEAGWPQLRIAETEKYAHVTYFFNGGREEPFPGEERILVPSPRVATYDSVPAMSAIEVTDRAVAWIDAAGPRVVVMNLANPDMIGHTGDLNATIEACRVTDRCVGRVAEAVAARKGLLFVTADHGNAEHMLDESGGPHTAHTLAPVPFVAAEAGVPRALRPAGGLRDVAPTVLEAAGLPVPALMTGRSLLCS